ncbi:MAG: hypothetical protein R3257_07410 [bacterium]|nr:hypothetical protein [bacterium]
MTVNQIPLCHYMQGLRLSGFNPAEIVPASSIAYGGAPCSVMVERGAPGNGVIGIPIVEYSQRAEPIEIGMRKIREDGRVVDIYHDPSRAPMVFREINPDRAKLAILGAFGPEELSNGVEEVSQDLLRQGVAVMAHWITDELERIEEELNSPGFQTLLSMAFFLNPIRTETDLRENNSVLVELEHYEQRHANLQSLMRRTLVHMPFSFPALEAFLNNP